MSVVVQDDGSGGKMGQGDGDSQELLDAKKTFFARLKALVMSVTLIASGLIVLLGTTERLRDGSPELFHFSAFKAWAESVDVDTPLAWGLSIALPLMLTGFVSGTLVRDPGKRWPADGVVSLAYLEDVVRLALLGLGVLFFLSSVVDGAKGGAHWLESIFAAGFLVITCLLGAIVLPDANRTRLSLALAQRDLAALGRRLENVSGRAADQELAVVRRAAKRCKWRVACAVGAVCACLAIGEAIVRGRASWHVLLSPLLMGLLGVALTLFYLAPWISNDVNRLKGGWWRLWMEHFSALSVLSVYDLAALAVGVAGRWDVTAMVACLATVPYVAAVCASQKFRVMRRHELLKHQQMLFGIEADLKRALSEV